jgi:hypothetical protein
MTKTSAENLDVAPVSAPKVEPVSPVPIFISEQQVAFATAAAMPVQPTKPRWRIRATRAMAASLHRMLVTTADSRPARTHYPRRYPFLENALMGREMDRL